MQSFDFVVACEKIKQVWDCCTQQTISNCFAKASFPNMPSPEPMAFPAPERNIWENIQRVLNTDMSFEEFAHMDDAVEASRGMTDEEIVETVMKENEDASNVQEVSGEDPDIMDDNSGETVRISRGQ